MRLDMAAMLAGISGYLFWTNRTHASRGRGGGGQGARNEQNFKHESQPKKGYGAWMILSYA